MERVSRLLVKQRGYIGVLMIGMIPRRDADLHHLMTSSMSTESVEEDVPMDEMKDGVVIAGHRRGPVILEDAPRRGTEDQDHHGDDPLTARSILGDDHQNQNEARRTQKDHQRSGKSRKSESVHRHPVRNVTSITDGRRQGNVVMGTVRRDITIAVVRRKRRGIDTRTT